MITLSYACKCIHSWKLVLFGWAQIYAIYFWKTEFRKFKCPGYAKESAALLDAVGILNPFRESSIYILQGASMKHVACATILFSDSTCLL
jgi:hypothetical protein